MAVRLAAECQARFGRAPQRLLVDQAETAALEGIDTISHPGRRSGLLTTTATALVTALPRHRDTLTDRQPDPRTAARRLLARLLTDPHSWDAALPVLGEIAPHAVADIYLRLTRLW
ncbi:hypothetical protein ACGFNU_49710 [Spirillospora sp. NPDC048911]|uniref:hypothetical protein n=1 Tax=Spirillospora sp. NPDC048911 TaxID=3364527 RepID=UPI00371C6A7B